MDTRRAQAEKALSLPVLPPAAKGVRTSRTSRWRAFALVFVHLLILGHIVHWWYAERTLSPVEPSEAMYTLNNGHVNAGFIFLAVSLGVTLLFGRFVCGWACHFVAYQDLCRWILMKIGVRPRPFRSRLLVFAPLALAFYMFAWPSVYRLAVGLPRPELSNHLMTAEFWQTFPGAVVGILSVVICGFVIIYFLGAKGFCTYACPYGALFAVADRVAPGRILVSDACEQCGHCTATCSSNVRVHEEVARYGMVVDSGCMKCMDCVSVCPKGALSFGFARPSLGMKSTAPPRPAPSDLTFWAEVVLAVVVVAALLSYRGLYDQVPLLPAMAIAVLFGFILLKGLQLTRSANIRLQNLQLRRGGRITRAGVVFVAGTVGLVVLTGHSAFARYQTWRGHLAFRSADIGEEVWSVSGGWWRRADQTTRAGVSSAIVRLEFADRWGLLSTPSVLMDLVWLYLSCDRVEDAEQAVRKVIAIQPERSELRRSLAAVLQRAGKVQDAEGAYRRALELDADSTLARVELGRLLRASGRRAEAIALYREAVDDDPEEVHWSIAIGELLLGSSRYLEAREQLSAFVRAHPDSARAHLLLGITALELEENAEGIAHMQKAVALQPDLTQARYNLGYAFLCQGRFEAAIEQLDAATRLDPSFAVAHYNLGVALFSERRLREAATHVRRSIELSPDDAAAHALLVTILAALKEAPDSAESAANVHWHHDSG